MGSSRAAHPLRATSSWAWLLPRGGAPLRDGQGRVAPSLARQIERHHVAPPVERPRADQAGGIVKEVHPQHVEIHDGVPSQLTTGRVQIHAIALAERINATPSNPSLAEVVVVHTARTPVHYRVAYMSAGGVVQVDAIGGKCRAEGAHKANEHEHASRPCGAVDATAEPSPEGHRLAAKLRLAFYRFPSFWIS